jgi:hypothetical protein
VLLAARESAIEHQYGSILGLHEEGQAEIMDSREKFGITDR